MRVKQTVALTMLASLVAACGVRSDRPAAVRATADISKIDDSASLARRLRDNYADCMNPPRMKRPSVLALMTGGPHASVEVRLRIALYGLAAMTHDCGRSVGLRYVSCIDFTIATQLGCDGAPLATPATRPAFDERHRVAQVGEPAEQRRYDRLPRVLRDRYAAVRKIRVTYAACMLGAGYSGVSVFEAMRSPPRTATASRYRRGLVALLRTQQCAKKATLFFFSCPQLVSSTGIGCDGRMRATPSRRVRPGGV